MAKIFRAVLTFFERYFSRLHHKNVDRREGKIIHEKYSYFIVRKIFTLIIWGIICLHWPIKLHINCVDNNWIYHKTNLKLEHTLGGFYKIENILLTSDSVSFWEVAASKRAWVSSRDCEVAKKNSSVNLIFIWHILIWCSYKGKACMPSVGPFKIYSYIMLQLNHIIISLIFEF